MTIDELIKKCERTKEEMPLGDELTTYGLLDMFIKDLKELKEIDYEPRDILLVEDGSIDLEKEQQNLNKMGYKVIVYRQGSNKPEILKGE